MLENKDNYLSTIIDLVNKKEYNKAKDKIDSEINVMITLDFKNRQDCIRKIVARKHRLTNILKALNLEIEGLPEDLRFHAREALRDTMESIEKKINDYQRQKSILSKPNKKTI